MNNVKHRLLASGAALAVLAGSLLVAPAAHAASSYSHGPYKTIAECKRFRAAVQQHADRVGSCYSWPRRGYYFTAYDD